MQVLCNNSTECAMNLINHMRNKLLSSTNLNREDNVYDMIMQNIKAFNSMQLTKVNCSTLAQITYHALARVHLRSEVN